ncbi:MAG: Type II secretory pathway component [Pseudomonadota bacterium]
MSRTLLLFLSLLLLAGSAVALDDPMRPPGSAAFAAGAASGAPQFVLSSTLIARERRSAVINGRSVGVGDHVNGARVIEIQPSQVRLQHQGRQLTLSLLPVAVKKPVSAE